MHYGGIKLFTILWSVWKYRKWMRMNFSNGFLLNKSFSQTRWTSQMLTVRIVMSQIVHAHKNFYGAQQFLHYVLKYTKQACSHEKSFLEFWNLCHMSESVQNLHIKRKNLRTTQKSILHVRGQKRKCRSRCVGSLCSPQNLFSGIKYLISRVFTVGRGVIFQLNTRFDFFAEGRIPQKSQKTWSFFLYRLP